jgi:hypothetical protein
MRLNSPGSGLRCLAVALVATLMTSNASRALAVDVEKEKDAILALIARVEAAWNRGDFHGYMEGFANPDVIFVSRGQFQKDWQWTLDHYVRDYQLDRPQDPQDGINTRLMRKRDGRWVIALNHVSSRQVPCGKEAEQ